MGVAQLLGRDTGSNTIPTALVVMVVILRVLTEGKVSERRVTN